MSRWELGLAMRKATMTVQRRQTPHRLPSSKPHRRMQKNQSESPVVTHGAEPPPSLAQLTADIISAYVSNRFTPPGM